MSTHENFSPIGEPGPAAPNQPQQPIYGHQLPKFDPIAAITETFSLLTKHFKLLLPLTLLAAFANAANEYVSSDGEPTGKFADVFGSNPLIYSVSLAIFILATIAIYTAGTKIAIAESDNGEITSLGAISRPFLRAMIGAVAIGLITFIPLLVGLAACLIPGLILATLWSVSYQALVAENLGPIEALKRSWSLVKPQLLQVLLLLLLVAIAYSVIYGPIILIGLISPSASAALLFVTTLIFDPFISLLLGLLFVRLRQLSVASSTDGYSSTPVTPNA